MRLKQYKFKFYLNAKHAIYRNEVLGEVHPHTWEITLHIAKKEDAFVQFYELEEEVQKYMDLYQGHLLNDMPPFDVLNPTLENCCEYFKDRFTEILTEKGWALIMMEMSDTPSHSYVINMCAEE